jgi:hypothetical protein
MSKASEFPDRFNESEDLIVGRTLRVINSLESEGKIGRYAIGGAVGLLFYTEPAVTYDLDIFCYLPYEGSLLNLGPIYQYLAEKGYEAKEEHIEIEGIPVQFLPPTTHLVEEALQNSVGKSLEGVSTRVFQYEHLLAIMAQTGRPKDKARIALALESAQPDNAKLEDILQRHNLLDKWRRMSV